MWNVPKQRKTKKYNKVNFDNMYRKFIHVFIDVHEIEIDTDTIKDEVKYILFFYFFNVFGI